MRKFIRITCGVLIFLFLWLPLHIVHSFTGWCLNFVDEAMEVRSVR